MVINIGRSFVSYITFNGAAVAEEYVRSRPEFTRHFSIVADSVASVSYEPDRALYHVTDLVGNVQVYASPEENEILSVLHAKRDDMYWWFVDAQNYDNPPSEYHTYDTTEHRWVIAVEAQALLAAHNARRVRNRLLRDSDWTQTTDSVLANKAAWATYRQALRDAPTQAGFPFEVVWPPVPG